jgi:2-octaprenylphenol hydroxylase
LRKAALDVLAESSLCTFFWEHELKSREEFQAPLLIGADGVHSQVRKLCHIETENFPTRQTALVFYIKIEKSHQFEAHQYFCAQGIVAFLPLPDAHHYSIVWSIPEDYAWIKDLNEAALASELNNICARRWGKITLTSTCQIFPLIQRQAQHYVLPGVALIGDAAHVIHPLAGQGANLGLADVAALTAQLKIAQQRHRHLGDIAILKPYERARRSAAWQMMMLMSMLKNFTSSSFIFSQTLLQGSRFLQRFSPLKNALSRFALYNFTK